MGPIRPGARVRLPSVILHHCLSWGLRSGCGNLLPPVRARPLSHLVLRLRQTRGSQGRGDTRGLPSQTRHIPHSPQVHPAVGLGEATKPLGAMAFLAENRGDNRKDPVRSTRDLMSLCPPRAGHSPRLPASPLSGRQSRPSSRMCGRAHGQQAVSGVAFPDLCFRPLGHAPEVFLCSSIRMYSFGKLVILQILAERLLGAGLYRMRGVRRGGRTDLGLPWPRSRSSLAPFPLPPHPNRTLFQGIGWDVFPSCWMASFIHQ